jgi:hypothetical protein
LVQSGWDQCDVDRSNGAHGAAQQEFNSLDAQREAAEA